jgi:predicted SprT family Zn-dependent metalloprotease
MNMSQETELYKCSCGHIQMSRSDKIAAMSAGVVDVYCPSCSKRIKLFKCSCDHVSMVETHTLNEVAPGIVNVTCPKCNKTIELKNVQ